MSLAKTEDYLENTSSSLEEATGHIQYPPSSVQLSAQGTFKENLQGSRASLVMNHRGLEVY